MQIRAHPGSRSLNRYLLEGDDITSKLRDRSASEVNFDGGKDTTAAKLRLGASSRKQCLVDIVVKDASKTSQILTAKIAREFFRKSVANRIRVTKTFSFDDFCRRVGKLEQGEKNVIHYLAWQWGLANISEAMYRRSDGLTS